jgi:hypothetical protein
MNYPSRGRPFPYPIKNDLLLLGIDSVKKFGSKRRMRSHRCPRMQEKQEKLRGLADPGRKVARL